MSTALPALQPDWLPPGYNLVGYELIRVIGAGGFGITYEAYNHVMERRVAIKEFYPLRLARRDRASQVVFTHVDDALVAWALNKFRATTTLLSRMRHPNILRVYDYMPINGTGYMVMEYIEGETLQSLVRQHGVFSPETLRPMLSPILDALCYVHEQGLIHRDIAPDNIMMTRDGRPVLIDFGAMSRDLSMMSQAEATRAIEKAGYTAPEQTLEKPRPAPTADIYSVGAVIYYALTGTAPKSASKRLHETILEKASDPLIPLTSLHPPGMPSTMAATVDDCLALNHGDRPQRMEALRERLGWGLSTPPETAETRTDKDQKELLTLAQQLPPTGRVLGPTEPLPQRHVADRPRRRGLGLLVVLSLGAFALVGGAFLYRMSPKQPLSDSQVEAMILACDQAAASPADGDRPQGVSGIAGSVFDAAAAVPICRTAVQAAETTNAIPAIDKRRTEFELGRALETTKNYAEARSRYEQAAAAGSVAAMARLGTIYENGLGVPQNLDTARDWYQKAAAAGDSYATFRLANLGEKK